MAGENDNYRRVKAAARTAAQRQIWARSIHIQRLAERETAQKNEDQLRKHLKDYGPSHGLEQSLRGLEFASKTASSRVEAAATVAAQADLAKEEAIKAADAVWLTMEDAAAVEANLRAETAPHDQTAHDAERARAWDQGIGEKFRKAEEFARQGEEMEETTRKMQEADLKHQYEKTCEDNANLMDERRRREAQQNQKQKQQAESEARGQEKPDNKQRRPIFKSYNDYEQELETADERAEKRSQQRREYEQRHYEWLQHTSPFRSSSMLGGIRVSHTLWKKNVDRAFSDYSAIKIFPEPPTTGNCSKPACVASQAQRALNACPCDVETAFTVLQLPLKEARLAWHPDRFSKCADELRESFQVCLVLTTSWHT